MDKPPDIVPTMKYNVMALTYSDPKGRIVASFTTLEQAEATREILNNTTHPSMLTFFIIVPSENPLAMPMG